MRRFFPLNPAFSFGLLLWGGVLLAGQGCRNRITTSPGSPNTPTPHATSTLTLAPSPNPTLTLTGSPIPATRTPSATGSASASPSPSRTASVTPTLTGSPTPTAGFWSCNTVVVGAWLMGGSGNLLNAQAGTCYFQRYTAVSSDNADSLWVAFWGVSGPFQLAIYNDASGRPGTRLGLSAAVTGGTGILAGNLGSPGNPGPRLTAGQGYWLALYVQNAVQVDLAGATTFAGDPGYLSSPGSLPAVFTDPSPSQGTGQVQLAAFLCSYYPTPHFTPSSTFTPTLTGSPTPIPWTSTPTLTGSPVPPTSTPTWTVGTMTMTATPTPTRTITPSGPPPTATLTRTGTPSATFTPTPTLTGSPIWTATPTATAYNTPFLGGATPGIFWSYSAVLGSGTNGTVGNATLMMAVNLAAETTAGVTLTTSLGDVPLTYVGSSNYGSYQLAQFSAAPFTYQPGDTYTMTTVTSIGAATAVLQAPGGGVSLTADGKTATWAYDGNRDFYSSSRITPSFNTFFSGNLTADVDSPLTLDPAAYPTAGTYSVQIHPQSSLDSITGGTLGTPFTIQQVVTFPVTIQ